MKKKVTLKQLEASKEMLDGIAGKHNVNECWQIIAFNDKGEHCISYHKRPDRPSMGSALSVKERDPLLAKEIILRATFLEGDERCYTDDQFFLSACTTVDEIFTINLGYIKKN